MKYWEKIKEPITKNETPWFVKFMRGVGFLIGVAIVSLFAVLAYLVMGYLFSLLWNFSVAPVFGANELTPYTGAALLFAYITGIKLTKWIFNK